MAFPPTAGDLADVKSAESTLTSCADDKVNVRIDGDTAVVMGHGSRAGTYKGAPLKDRQIYYTDVYVRRNGQWQCVASQGHSRRQVINPLKSSSWVFVTTWFRH